MRIQTLWGPALALVLGSFGFCEEDAHRIWTDATGKHKIEAEFVRIDDSEIVLRKPDGTPLRVELAKLSETDRATAETMEMTRADRVAIDRTSRKFLQLLRQANREGAEELITSAAKTLWESEQSPIKNIPSVDRGSKPRVREVEIDGDEAVVIALLRYKGKGYPAELHLRQEDEHWLIYAASGEDEEGHKLHFNFEGGGSGDGVPATAAAAPTRPAAVIGNVQPANLNSVNPLPNPTGDAAPGQNDAAAGNPGTSGNPDLLSARSGFTTTLISSQGYTAAGPAPEPPDDMFELIKYPSPVGQLTAYLTPDPRDNQTHAAVIWAHGGFGGVGEWLWEDAPADNDQTARAFREAGLILMCPSWRGENDNPGEYEMFFGEVEDVIAAGKYLTRLPYVDPSRIYLAGHSTGGTIALLAAESTDMFRAVFSFGGAPDIAKVVADGEGYGNTPYDYTNQKENELRSPINFISALRSPTFYFEGAIQSFYPEDARLMEAKAKAANVPLTVSIIENGSHFDILAPLTTFVAEKILADTGHECAIEITSAEANARFNGLAAVTQE